MFLIICCGFVCS